jgi:hypothetical protein
MSPFVVAVAEVVFVALVTWWVPRVGIRMLAESLAASPVAQRTNYRGQTVFIGLGIVWVFWVAGMVVLRYAGQTFGFDLGVFVSIGAVVPLMITTVLFGVIDDAYGGAGDRGFRGHISALTEGRITTGALKLLGITFVSVAAASSIVGVGSGDVSTPGALSSPRAFAIWAGWTLVLGALIALSANLVNLMDLRPGRALKVYGTLAVALVVVAAALSLVAPMAALLLALALAGPLAAAWPLDAGERGMLGDAGANAAGALLGFIAAWECGRSWAAIVIVVVLFALNLASEKWSFSVAISKSRVLSALDGAGRPSNPAADENSRKSSPHSTGEHG